MKRHDPRRVDSGAITVLATFLLLTLFAMAALAVDVGFLYTRSRMIYAVADGIVAAGMGDIVNGSQASATTDVTNMASQYSGVYTVTSSTTASQLSVTVSATYPMYFGKIFGLASKTISVTAVGQVTNIAPALLSLGSCGSGALGLRIGGQANMTINGNVESNGTLNFNTGVPPTVVTGFAESPCVGSPSLGGGSGLDVEGGTGSGGPFPDPYSAVPTTLPPCTYGSLLAPYAIPNVNWGPGGVLAPGVYCSGGALNAASIDPCQCMNATGVSFIALGDINLGNNGTSTISAAPGMPDGIVAYSASADDCTTGQAINIGYNDFNVQGSFYAPNGCINVGNNGILNINGSLIGNSVQLGSNGTWTIGATGGGGGTSWQMLQ